MAFKVVVTVDLGPTHLEEEVLGPVGASLITAPARTEDQLIDNCRDADAVLIGPNEPFTARVIATLGSCRVLSRLGIGYNNIDVEAATAQGIPVSIVPDYCVSEVSDHAMAFLLAFARRVVPLSQAVKAGQWQVGNPAIARIGRPAHRMSGQTLGIAGLGRIGRALASKAQAFGLRVIAFDPYLPQEQARGLGVELVDFDRLLGESDYISIHALLNAETKHLFNVAAFRKMKPTAYIINNARGGLIDEQALHTALKEGWIAGAGLDVTDPEPPAADNPLLQLDNVLITPHFSYYSEESTVELRQRAVEAVVQVLQGGWPRFMANPEVKDR